MYSHCWGHGLCRQPVRSRRARLTSMTQWPSVPVYRPRSWISWYERVLVYSLQHSPAQKHGLGKPSSTDGGTVMRRFTEDNRQLQRRGTWWHTDKTRSIAHTRHKVTQPRTVEPLDGRVADVAKFAVCVIRIALCVVVTSSLTTADL